MIGLTASAAGLFAQYNTTILPVPAGIPDDGNTSIVPATTSPINNKGQVAATVNRPGMDGVPAVWTNGVPTLLPVPDGYRLYALKAINDAGVVVGQIQAKTALGNASQPVVWNGTTPTIIPHFPAPCASNTNEATYISTPIAINRAGHIAGETHKADACDWGWIWDGAQFTTILTYTATCGGAPRITSSLTPMGINDADHVFAELAVPNPITGSCESGSFSTPALIVPGRSVSLLAVPASYNLTLTGNQINNLDQTYGVFPSGQFLGAFFWNGTNYINANVPPPTASFVAMNNLGQALLLEGFGGNPQVSTWQNGTRTPITLASPITRIDSPAGLNDAGQIAGYATLQVNGVFFSRTAVLTPSGGCAADVTSEVAISRGGFRLNRATGHFTQLVTVTNNSGASIPGPISVVFDNVPSNATLFGLSGATACNAPAGSPFISAPSDLASGQSVTVTLEFIDTANTGITYSTRVIAGAGIR